MVFHYVIDRAPSIEELPVEIVERKGLGHPDSICDSVAEEVSLYLSRYYLEKLGRILHHNVDKVLLVGGEAEPRFGGGKLIKPIRIIVAGRLTAEIFFKGNKEKIPFGIIIKEATYNWIKNNFRFLDPLHHVTIDYKVGPGSLDLKSLLEKKSIPLANDTSIGIGYAPLSLLEKIVLETEKFLNSQEFKKAYPAVGEDIKVLGVRHKKKIQLTVASAMVSPLIASPEEYIYLKKAVQQEIKQRVLKLAPDYNLDIYINTGDQEREGIFYLTITGTSAEQGDDGATGRGNRVNGLITPFRPMTMEATAGKNPVNHVGKIYNVAAKDMAETIYSQYSAEGIKEVYVLLVSQIGKPINQPQVIYIKIKGEKDYKFTRERKSLIEAIIREKIDNIQSYTEKILQKELGLF